MSNVKLTVRIGAVSRTFDGISSGAADYVAAATMGDLINDIKTSTSLALGKIAKNMPKVVETSYIDAVMFAAKKMIGTKSPQGAGNRNANGGKVDIKDPDGDTMTQWQVLAPRTIREQNVMQKSKGSGEFFNQTGALRMDLIGMARKYVKNTGVVKVTYNGTLRAPNGRFISASRATSKVSLGNFSIRLMPNINSASIPGIRSGISTDYDPSLSFERKLGFSAAAIRKLRGAGKGDFVIPGTHRPLMQPVFTYWTLNRIPQVIARSITAAMPQRAKINNSSGQSYSV